MADSNWPAAADEIGEGWRVRRYSNVDGESYGTVTSGPELNEEVFSVSVGWEYGGRLLEETLSEPSWRRSLRRSDDSVIIGSTDSVLVFEPE